MILEYTEEQKSLRETLLKFARQELNDDLESRDREQVFAADLWKKMGEMGIPGLAVSEEYGGGGLDPLSTAIALEALGQGCWDGGLLFSLCAHMLPCAVPIDKFGTEEQKRKYLPGLCDGSLIASNAMTEANTGSDAFAMTTKAEKDGEHYVLTGNKIFITNAPVADLFVAFALTDAEKGFHGGVSCFIVEMDTPGVSCSRKIEKMGIRTSPFGEISFQEARVPAANMLGGEGAGATMFTHSMDWERALLSAIHVGAMERLLETATTYARTRSQFGRPIERYPAIREHVARIKAHLESSRLMVYRSADRLEKSRSVSQDAALSKLFVSEAFVDAAERCIQIHGGYGFTTEYKVERVLRDAIGGKIYSGTSEMMINIVAAWLGMGSGT